VNRLELIRLKIPDVILLKRNRHSDKRGFTCGTYDRSEYRSAGIRDEFVQDLLSYSVENVLRGLHYQEPPKVQSKLVVPLHGLIFDVALDIRNGSPTFGEWVGVTLSSEDDAAIYIPKGFAHGFCVLSSEAMILYKLSSPYDADLDRGIAWNDPEVGIRWPVDAPILSERDAHLPSLRSAKNRRNSGLRR
jgi:dTDP-4-dehydrorhamnose 3,5-epimerase